MSEKKNCGQQSESEGRVIGRSCSICEHPKVKENSTLQELKMSFGMSRAWYANYSHFSKHKILLNLSAFVHTSPLSTPCFLTISSQNSIQETWTLENLSLLYHPHLSSHSLTYVIFLIPILSFFLGLPIFDPIAFIFMVKMRKICLLKEKITVTQHIL